MNSHDYSTKTPRSTTRVRVHWGRIMVISIFTFILLEGVLAFARKIVLERHIHNNLVATRQELEQLRERNLEIKREEEALYTPEKIEELAREKLDLAKPGEIAVKVISGGNSGANIRTGNEKQGNPREGFWKKAKEEWPLKWLLKLVPS